MMPQVRRYGCRIVPVMLAVAASLAGCGSEGVPVSDLGAVGPGPVPGTLEGYLLAAALPDSLALIPPAPAEGSAALALDIEISQKSFALRDTARWTLAISDADLSFPHAEGLYACAVQAAINEAETPHLYMLLRRSLTDLGVTTVAAKRHYQRTRPFVLNSQPICTPADEAGLRADGSYPSGHTTVGWGWALLLAELAPEKANAILARGLAFGESRNVCNVHWHSDVVQGRSVAASTVAVLHSNAAFLTELAAARGELTAARGRGLPASVDCAAEAAALALLPSLAQ